MPNVIAHPVVPNPDSPEPGASHDASVRMEEAL